MRRRGSDDAEADCAGAGIEGDDEERREGWEGGWDWVERAVAEKNSGEEVGVAPGGIGMVVAAAGSEEGTGEGEGEEATAASAAASLIFTNLLHNATSAA